MSGAASSTAAEIARAAGEPGAARALALDLDGTLAPLAAHPANAWVPDAVLIALARLVRRGWRIAIVSGRPVVQVRRMVPVQGVALFGSHGIEQYGVSTVTDRLSRIATRSARLARQARRFVGAFRGAWVERKPFGCAFHHGALGASERARFHRRLRAWLAARDTRGLEILHGVRVVELRPAGMGKGLIARRWAPARRARRRDLSLVVIGDDRTDEELFAALGDRALTIRVGSARQATVAIRRLSGPRAVAHLLTALAARPAPVP